jgi:hypothetical protein
LKYLITVSDLLLSTVYAGTLFPSLLSCAPLTHLRLEMRSTRELVQCLTGLRQHELSCKERFFSPSGSQACSNSRLGKSSSGFNTNKQIVISSSNRKTVSCSEHRGRLGTEPSAGYPLDLWRVATAARPRSGQPELFEAQRQVRRLSGGELIQVKAPAVASERNGFPEKHCFTTKKVCCVFFKYS